MSPGVKGDDQQEDLCKILQKYSINYLLNRLDRVDMFDEDDDRMARSISDLFGLNSPRGLLGNSLAPTSTSSGSSDPNAFYTAPGQSFQRTQLNFDDGKLSNNLSGSTMSPTPGCFKNFQNVPNLGAAPSNRNNVQHHVTNRMLRSSSLSDNSGSNSPLAGDSPMIGTLANSRDADSPDNSDSAISSPDGSLTELINTLTLNEAVTRNCLHSASLLNDVDIASLQAIQALKYLQQPSNVFSSLLNRSTCVPGPSQVLDKMGGNAALNLMNFANQVQDLHLDRVARFHRNAASVYDATCTWSGVLPVRSGKPSGYSSKVFLGGVPWDVTDPILLQTFKQFGNIRIEWPGKEKQATPPKGYVYIIFESEKNVRTLLQNCTNDAANSSNWYFRISSKKMKSKEVQVIPWLLNDSNYSKTASQKLDPSKTIFVGALHGMLNAEGLAKVMNDLFDGVVYAGIDTDKYKYPIGSGRVTFNNPRSYMKAVAAAFIEIKAQKFTKKVQVDPYLEDSMCSTCNVHQGPYFCRDLVCFRYFCRNCWQWSHQSQDTRNHKPLMRNSKDRGIVGLSGAAAGALN